MKNSEFYILSPVRDKLLTIKLMCSQVKSTFCSTDFGYLGFICLNKTLKCSLYVTHIKPLYCLEINIRDGILKGGSFTLHQLLRGVGHRFANVGEEHLKGTDIADRMVPQESYRSAQPGTEYKPQGRFL